MGPLLATYVLSQIVVCVINLSLRSSRGFPLTRIMRHPGAISFEPYCAAYSDALSSLLIVVVETCAGTLIGVFG